MPLHSKSRCLSYFEYLIVHCKNVRIINKESLLIKCTLLLRMQFFSFHWNQKSANIVPLVNGEDKLEAKTRQRIKPCLESILFCLDKEQATKVETIYQSFIGSQKGSFKKLQFIYFYFSNHDFLIILQKFVK